MPPLLKAALDSLALLLVLPALLAYRCGGLLFGSPRVFPGWSQAFSIIPGLCGIYLRRAFYRLILPRCGPGCCVSFGTVFSHPTAEVGKDVYVGLFCTIGDVTLEDDVLVSSHVSIINGGSQHSIERLDIPVREQPCRWIRVTIGRDTWIGERATVMADVGEHCVIGAGSVVASPIPDYAVASGCPARVIRFRGHYEETDSDPCRVAAERLSHMHTT